MVGLMKLAQPAIQLQWKTPQEASPMFWMEWNTKHKLRYLSSLTTEPRRREAHVWKAWSKLIIPLEDKLIMQKALWKNSQ